MIDHAEQEEWKERALEKELRDRDEKRAKECGFSCAEEMRGEMRRSGLIP